MAKLEEYWVLLWASMTILKRALESDLKEEWEQPSCFVESNLPEQRTDLVQMEQENLKRESVHGRSNLERTLRRRRVQK